MQPGRELDALIEEKVMGPKPQRCLCTMHEICRACSPDALNYSTDIASAWEVVEKLGNRYLVTIRDGYGNIRPGVTAMRAHYVSISGHSVSVVESGDSAPHAICLAALKAVGAL